MQQNSTSTNENIVKSETFSKPGSHVTKLALLKATALCSCFDILPEIVQIYALFLKTGMILF